MQEIKDFILHLRLNYNFLILSAPYFLGATYVSTRIDLSSFILSFFAIYFFLFGGANAYNSYFDKDEGPIGGLKNPPKMKRWMYYCSWILQLFGLYISFRVSTLLAIIFLTSIILFWLYSGPYFRFKGKPLLSFLVIGIGTVFNTSILGYLSAGGLALSIDLIIGSLGATLIILSMYPFSQAYQIDEDTRRGDVTFASKYGVQGIKNNFKILFVLGLLLMSYSFIENQILATLVMAIGLVAFYFIWKVIKDISTNKDEYHKIMLTKYIGGIAFTVSMILILFIKITI